MNKLLIAFCILLFSCSSNKQQEPEKKTGEPVPSKVLLKQPAYELEYYSNWNIDSTESGNGSVKLNAPSKSSFATMVTFNKAIDEKEFIKQQVDNFVPKLVKDAAVSYFTKWGSYDGYGAKIEGYLGVQKTEVKVFASKQAPTSFGVITQLLVGNRAAEEPGLQLIETSFKMNK